MIKLILFEIAMFLSIIVNIFIKKQAEEKITVASIVSSVIIALSYLGVFYEPTSVFWKIAFIAFGFGQHACFTLLSFGATLLMTMFIKRKEFPKSDWIIAIGVILLSIIFISMGLFIEINVIVVYWNIMLELSTLFFDFSNPVLRVLCTSLLYGVVWLVLVLVFTLCYNLIKKFKNK